MGDIRETFILTTPDNAYTLANEIKSDFNTHIAATAYHKAADTTNTVSASDATTLATLYTLVNEMKGDYNAHIASTTYHRVADTNAVTSHDAASVVAAYELLNELKEEYNRHIASVTYHKVADTSNPITALSSNLGAVNKDFNADGGSVLVELTGAGSWDGTVDFQTTPDGATFFNIPYINRATITPTPTVAQISSPSTAALYLLFGPLSQVRIACVTGTQGTLTVVYRTIDKSDYNVTYLAAGGLSIGLTGHDVTGVGDGIKVVATAGTDVVLASSTTAKLVIIQAQTDNTNKIAVGATGVDATVATGTGILLDPGDAVTLPVDDLADVYIDALVSGEGVRYMYFT